MHLYAGGDEICGNFAPTLCLFGYNLHFEEFAKHLKNVSIYKLDTIWNWIEHYSILHSEFSNSCTPAHLQSLETKNGTPKGYVRNTVSITFQDTVVNYRSLPQRAPTFYTRSQCSAMSLEMFHVWVLITIKKRKKNLHRHHTVGVITQCSEW